MTGHPDLFADLAVGTSDASRPTEVAAGDGGLQSVYQALCGADAPDRRLDVRLAIEVLPPVSDVAIRAQFDVPPFTGDEHWAKALLETILPDWWWTLGKCKLNAHASCGPDRDGADRALLGDKTFDEGFDADCDHGVPALALVTVAIAGLIARRRAKGETT